MEWFGRSCSLGHIKLSQLNICWMSLTLCWREGAASQAYFSYSAQPFPKPAISSEFSSNTNVFSSFLSLFCP